MAHYTLTSGIQTVTQSVYCPTCQQRRIIHGHPEVLPLLGLACTEGCAQAYMVKLRALCMRQHWEAWQVIEHMQIVAGGFTSEAMAEAMAGAA